MNAAKSPLPSVLLSACLLGGVAGFMTGCSTAPKGADRKARLDDEVRSAASRAYERDAGLRDFLARSAGYAVFPAVGKGAFIVGGAYGRGELLEHGMTAGYCDVSQGTVGAQVGGQSYTEIIAFEAPRDVERFKAGKFAFSANASAVALKSGASSSARYTDGVAVFVMGEQGLMLEAAIGGQSFTYEPLR